MFTLSMGLFCILHADTSTSVSIGLGVPLAIGAGCIYGEKISFHLSWFFVTLGHARSYVLSGDVAITCERECPCSGVLWLLSFICWCEYTP